MEKSFEGAQKCDKKEIFRGASQRMTALFSDVEDSKRHLVEGLIQEAAFLEAENASLRAQLAVTGTVKVRPGHPEQQKPIEAARQYRQNVLAYSTIIKTLNGILDKGAVEDEDNGMEEFE